jgi:hypothetical protein
MSYLKLFRSLMEKGIISAVSTFREMAKGFILPFGIILIGLYQRGFTFITEITTGQIIGLKTSSFYLLLYTYRYTPKQRNIEREAENISESLLNQRRLNGISQKKVENGTENTQGNRLKNGFGLRKFVLSAIKFIEPLSNFITGQNSAIRIVKLQPCGSEEVYDLTVPRVENFTINGGIVVHNCVDADRYFIVTLHDNKELRPKSALELRMEEYNLQRGFTQELGDIYKDQL